MTTNTIYSIKGLSLSFYLIVTMQILIGVSLGHFFFNGMNGLVDHTSTFNRFTASLAAYWLHFFSVYYYIALSRGVRHTGGTLGG